jgi:hypothetical protein
MTSEGDPRRPGAGAHRSLCGNASTVSTVLTAADETFARTLWQYLMSVERARLSDSHRWVAYDLGLIPATLERLVKRFPWCAFKRFEYESWPHHLRLEYRNYAWKPVLLAGEVLCQEGVVLWFDCATLFRGPPDDAIRTARADGLWYLRGQTPLYLHADCRSLDAMDVPPEVRHLNECVTGALAFNASDPMARRIVEEWRDHALRQDVIAPAGATVDSHKYDQALLSGEIFKAVKARALPLSLEEIDIGSSRPVRWMTSRNKVSPNVPVWMDPAVRFYYAAYKWMDVHWLRASRRSHRRLGGLRRFLVEHFVVSVTEHRTGRTRQLRSPGFGYFADPFIWSKDDGIWVFAEEFLCAEDRGKLVVLELDGDLTVKRKADITTAAPHAAFDCHVSFPFVFEDRGNFYMIPETSQRRTLDLYQCEVWPDRWRLARRLILDIDAADTMAIRHHDRWYILTSVRTGDAGRHLEIYSCADIAADPLVAHPANDKDVDGGAPYGSGRNAGLIAPASDGMLRRFVQQSTHYYGQGGGFRRIVRLSADAFEEETTLANQRSLSMGAFEACHHYSSSGGYAAHDRRTRTKVWDFLARRRSSAD